MGFVRGREHTAVFHHASKDINTLVRGDDYFSAGTKDALDWLELELKNKYQNLFKKNNNNTHGCVRSAETRARHES